MSELHNRNGIDVWADETVVVPAPNRLARGLRLLTATLFVIVLGLSMAAIGLFFLLRGEAVENSALTAKVESAIQNAMGSKIDVELGKTSLGFVSGGLLSLVSNDVRLTRTSDHVEIANLGTVTVGIRPFSLFSAVPSFNEIRIENASLDALLLPVAAGNVTPPDLEGLLGMVASRLDALSGEIETGRFTRLKLSNVRLTNARLGRRESSDLIVKSLDLRRKPGELLSIDASIVTALSDIKTLAGWTRSPDGGRNLAVSLEGLNASEWAMAPLESAGQIGTDADLSVVIDLPVSVAGTPQAATLKLTTGDALLRIGEEAITDFHELSLNAVLDPVNDEIRITPSQFAAGEFRTGFSGAFRPSEGSNWLEGALVFEVETADMARTPIKSGEPPASGNLKLSGTWEPATKILSLTDAGFQVGNDVVTGTATLGFSGLTPSIKSEFSSSGMEIAAVKQFWPMFVAPAARKWTFLNVSGGRVSEIKLKSDLPTGVVGRFRKGARMQPEEYLLSARFDGVAIKSFGELPVLEEASGQYTMNGMEVRAALAKGRTQVEGFGPVAVEAGSFRIADIGIRPNLAELQITASGAAKDVAAIAESKPLTVLTRIEMKPQTVSGKAHFDLAANFPLQRAIAYDDVKWNAIIELKKASSSAKVLGRMIKDADLLVEATPRQVRVNGDATVDGNRTKLAMVEPIGGSDVSRERSISAELDDAARKKMGLVLDPVLSGSIKVDLKQLDGGAEKQTVVLDEAQLSLPWVGWSKGKGIPAKATFAMKTDKGITRLDDFYIEGTGFSASGSLVLDKSGLKQADFVDISLNDGDSFSLKLERVGKAGYKINVSGQRYDARSLINRLFHEKGFGEDQGDSTMLLTANLGEVRGFNGRTLSNVELSYGSKGSWLDHISLRGAFSDTTYLNVHAVTEEGKTTFEIDATDAGTALAYTAVYPRMTGGAMRARLTRIGGGPFLGQVSATDFYVVDEPRIRSLVSEPSVNSEGRASPEVQAELQRIDTKRVRFSEARGLIEKGEGYFRVNDGIINNAQIGFTFDGLVFDQKNRMELSGTFLPAVGLSRVIGYIPLVGEILGNGRDSGLIGVTYRLSGPAKNPTIEINPVSVVAPGIFRKIFEFEKEGGAPLPSSVTPGNQPG